VNRRCVGRSGAALVAVSSNESRDIGGNSRRHKGTAAESAPKELMRETCVIARNPAILTPRSCDRYCLNASTQSRVITTSRHRLVVDDPPISTDKTLYGRRRPRICSDEALSN